MDLIEALANVNALAVFLGAVAAFGLGALWYSPLLFAKLWTREQGWTEKQLKERSKDSNLLGTMAGSFALTCALALALGVVFNAVKADGLIDGVVLGLLLGLGLTVTTLGIHGLFEGRSKNLFFINAGYNLAMCTIICMILGLWPS